MVPERITTQMEANSANANSRFCCVDLLNLIFNCRIKGKENNLKLPQTQRHKNWEDWEDWLGLGGTGETGVPSAGLNKLPSQSLRNANGNKYHQCVCVCVC